MKVLKRYFLYIGVFILFELVFIANVEGQKLEAYPSNWFTQMKWNKVQILFRSTSSNFASATVKTNYQGVQILGVHHFENGHYLAVDIDIAQSAKEGAVNFIIQTKTEKINTSWTLLPRRKGRGSLFAQGINASDLIYFLMPDIQKNL